MSAKRNILAQSIILVFLALRLSTAFAQASGHGPEIRSFLELMRHEQEELDYQIKHGEIAKRDYIRAKTKIAINRETVLSLAKESGEDYVPELHVVASSELDQLIEGGTKAVRVLKRGEMIRDKWRYLGSVNRGEIFYIFELVKRN